MPQQQQFPFTIVLLNAIGGILIGLGLIDYFGDIMIIPEAFRIDNYQFILFITGILLQLPFIKFLVNYTLDKLSKDI